MAQEFPTVQDIEPSWSDIKLTFSVLDGGTIDAVDIIGVKWTDSVEVGDVYGASGGRKIKRTTGKYSCEASATFLRSGWKSLRAKLVERALAAFGEARISLVVFDMIVQWTPPGTTDIDTVKVAGCRVTGRDSNPAEGTDPDQIEVALNPMFIAELDENGNVVTLL